MKWIERDILDQLDRDTGGELLPELVTLFVEDGQQSLRGLAQALAAQDRESLKLLAHSLKSVCATYGALVCRDQALSLEQACQQEEWPLLSRRVSELQNSLRQSFSAVLSLSHQLS